MAAAVLLSVSGCASDKEAASSVPDQTESSSQAVSDVSSKAGVNYQARLDKDLKNHEFEGVVYITENGEVLCQSATGKTNAESAGDITIDSKFCIGSISKQFAATAIMMLSEDGKLSVDDTLDKYFEEYAIGKDITIKNLLTMRSGVPDFYGTNEEENDEYNSEESAETGFTVYEESDAYDNQLAIKEWLFNQPLDFEPDTNFEYSNSNYLILSMIVENVSGTDYHSFIRKNIFEPLSMENSGFIDERKSMTDFADSMEPFDMAAYPGVSNGAGDIISNAKDMDIWLTSLRENKLISAESFAEMTTNYSEEGSVGYGYGLMLPNSGGAMHTGRIATYSSAAYTNEKYGYNLFAVTNNSSDVSEDINSLLSQLLQDTMNK